jgi:hypothetical protein
LHYSLVAAEEMNWKRNVLIVSPLMVVRQTMAEANRFYGGEYPIEQIPAGSSSSRISGRLAIGD